METIKPKVLFVGEPRFDTTMFPGYEVARVMALNHYSIGAGEIRTSEVVEKFEDGSFETLNTHYVPYKHEDNV